MRIQYDRQGKPLIGGWLYLVGVIIILAIICIIFTSLSCAASLTQNGFGNFVRNNFIFGIIMSSLIFIWLYFGVQYDAEPSNNNSNKQWDFVKYIFGIYAIFTINALPTNHSFFAKYFRYKQLDYIIYCDMMQFLLSFLEITLLSLSLYLFSVKHKQFIVVYLSSILFDFISISIILLACYNGLNKMSGNTDATSIVIFGLVIHFIVILITSLYLLNSERAKITFSGEKNISTPVDYSEEIFTEEVKQPQDAKAIVYCPKCAQKIAVTPGGMLQITCPTCQTKFEVFP